MAKIIPFRNKADQEINKVKEVLQQFESFHKMYDKHHENMDEPFMNEHDLAFLKQEQNIAHREARKDQMRGNDKLPENAKLTPEEIEELLHLR